MARALKWEFGIVAGLAAATVAAAWLHLHLTPIGLVARYWRNPELQGPPAAEAVRAIPSVDDLDRRMPGPLTSVSAEWAGYLVVETAGAHEFVLSSDDGSWLDIDGATAIDNGGEHGPREMTQTVALEPGPHHIRVRYFQAAGGWTLRLQWAQPGLAPRPITIFDVAPTEAAARQQMRMGRLTRAVSLSLPVAWALLFLYVPARLGGWLTWREVKRAAPRAEDRRRLAFVLTAGAGLMVWGISFGLEGGWAPDELRSGVVRHALLSGFSHGWYDKYPLMHFAVLSLPLSAFEIAHRLAILPADMPVADAAQLALSRLVSLLAGVGTLCVAYLCAAELYGARRAVASAAVLLLTPLFLYYGKIANLDVPSLFWFGWAVLGFVRVVKFNRTEDYVLLGVAAAAAVATKDQHYANLALIPLGVLVVNARQQPSSTWLSRVVRACLDRRVWLGGAAAVGASAVLHNVVFNFNGFVAHVEELVSYGPILALVPATAAGYAELTRRTGELLAFGMGWAWAGAAVIGVAGAISNAERRWWLWLLIVPLSFHLAYTWPTRNVHDRYLFGGVFVLSLFAGSGLTQLWEAGRRARWTRLLAGAALICSLLYSVSINVMMTRDTRYEAGEWVHRNAPPGGTVGLLGGPVYMPVVGPRVRVAAVAPEIEDLARVDPDLLVINARYSSRYRARAPGRALLDGLAAGSLGYREVFRRRAAVPMWALLQYATPFAGGRESEWTNLDKVNPEMVIYERSAPRPDR